jgi:signal transduction histidine kinase
MRLVQGRLKLKYRVTFGLVAIVTLFVSVQGLLAYLSIEEQEDELADEWVLAEARRLAGHAERGELSDPRSIELFTPTPTLSAWLADASGNVIPSTLPEHLKALADGPHRPSGFGAALHIVVLSTTHGRLYVQYDASDTEAKVHQFGVYLLGLGLLCIVLGLFVARWIAAIVVAPIDRLTEQLTNWVPEATVADTAGSDEENRLLEAFRRVQSRFEEAIAREREFVANIRHEIRTPLTALRTDLEMLTLSAEAQSSPHARLQRALAMVDAVTASLESARVLARRAHTEAQAIDLAHCVDDAWASLGSYPGINSLRFVNAVPAATIVNADRHALLTILRNLIRNAAEHAAPAQCIVRCTDHGIEVVDDGPGIPAEDLPFVFERYYRGRLADSPGADPGDHGIGLAIARQVADINGWTLTASSEAGKGARFVLRLP